MPCCASIVDTLKEFNLVLQQNFPRPEGMERQEISDKFIAPDIRREILPLLSAYITEISTGNDTAIKLLLGANENAMRVRFDILVKLESEKHYTEIVYPLGGERKLWAVNEPITLKMVAARLADFKKIKIDEATKIVKKQFNKFFASFQDMMDNRSFYSDLEVSLEVRSARLETSEYFTNLGIIWPTETDMMEHLILEYHAKLANVNFSAVVNAPKKINQKGEIVRPNTIDTYQKLWELYKDVIEEEAGKSLTKKIRIAIISNQPFARAQEQQALDYFSDKPVEIDVIASEYKSNNINISKIFRSFTETIHAGEKLVLKKLS